MVSGVPTWRSKENGRHSWKVALDRKSLKNCGQEGWVKLSPILESKGRGSDVETGVATWTDSETEEVEDGARIHDDPVVVVADELLESSCLA
jgi:hypothetical protein